MEDSVRDRRRHIRHPIQVPLAIRPRGAAAAVCSTVGDLSAGGLSFSSPLPVDVGSRVEVELPVGERRFALVGAVARCEPTGETEGFRVGLAFVEPDMSFRMKLAEQVLRIEELRNELTRERGADVTEEEAARSWVEHCARQFADVYAETG
jgi:hypothetical protein